jgi:CDP-diacylglycerol--serine O-phosphatidyltransferase
MSEKTKTKAMNIIPFLPSVLTLGSVVCGIIALLIAARTAGEVQVSAQMALLRQACWLIVAAMIFDVMDGKVARAMDAESLFGQELDSLADVISFGVVPAFIANRFIHTIFHLSDREMSRRGSGLIIGITVVFVICAVLRLARYNVETDGVPHSHLVGLPTPGAAGFVVANMLFFMNFFGHSDKSIQRIASYAYIFQSLFPFVVLIAAVLMVSRIRFIHFGNMITGKMHSFSFLVISVFFILPLVWKPIEICFFGIWIYLLWGLVPGMIKLVVNRGDKGENGETDEMV